MLTTGNWQNNILIFSILWENPVWLTAAKKHSHYEVVMTITMKNNSFQVWMKFLSFLFIKLLTYKDQKESTNKDTQRRVLFWKLFWNGTGISGFPSHRPSSLSACGDTASSMAQCCYFKIKCKRPWQLQLTNIQYSDTSRFKPEWRQDTTDLYLSHTTGCKAVI